MISDTLKETIKAVLYASAPDDDTMFRFNGVKSNRANRYTARNSKERTYANRYTADVLEFKLAQIREVSTNSKEIMLVLNTYPTDVEMAENSGVLIHSIRKQIKDNSHGIRFHRNSCLIEKIAKLVDAG